MSDSIARSDLARRKAEEVIEESRVIDIWRSIGATVNSVGSVRMGLIASRRDIDFHIYTDPFVLADSFAAVARFADNPKVRALTYGNLIDEVDRCVEWHATWTDHDGDWQIDMIHILPDSRYVGHFEKVADRIVDRLTPETRRTILDIKFSLSPDEHIMGIQVYQAVLDGGVRDLASFRTWLALHPADGIIEWLP